MRRKHVHIILPNSTSSTTLETSRTNMAILERLRICAIHTKKKRDFIIFTGIVFTLLIFFRYRLHGSNYKLKEETDNSRCLLERRNFTTTSNRTFLYLVQGPSCLPEHLKGERQIGCGSTCNCDILMLGYKQKCLQPRPKHVEYIHKAGTTWSTGRNYLYEYALNRTTKYLYYIFMDEDITLQPNSNTNDVIVSYGLWRSFERYLLDFKPAIGSVSYCSFTDTRCNSKKTPRVHVIQGFFVDAAFNAIHYEALPYLLPYHLKRENNSWWYSQYYLTLLARHYFEGFVLVYTELNAVNIRHRDYPKESVSNEKLIVLEKEIDDIIKQRKKNPPTWNRLKVREIAEGFCKC